MPRRLLSVVERAEAQPVFGSGLDYTRVFVVENTPLPNWIADVGRSPKPNAVTLFNVSYFPETLQITEADVRTGNLRQITWLIHELTHQWQFQRLGLGYLTSALWTQLTRGQQGYPYRLQDGHCLMDFNMEQQGDIARDYYKAFAAANRDESAPTLVPFTPFIVELKSGAYR
jgi:type VI secretion system secreted protein VgrG